MTRRDTIISAALINAGLLVILFVCALGIDETIDASASHAPFASTLQTLPSTPSTDSLATMREVGGSASSHEISLQPVASAEGESQTVAVRDSSSSLLEVKVQKGDRLDTLAKQHGTTVERLVEVNHLSSTQLVIGQILLISPANESRNESRPSEPVVKTASSKSTSASPSASSLASQSSQSSASSKVATVSSMSKPTSVNTAKKSAASSPSTENRKPSSPPVKPATPPTASTSEAPQYHYVQKNENPWTIAKKYNITVEKLLKLNHLDEATARRLREGDRLRVR